MTTKLPKHNLRQGTAIVLVTSGCTAKRCPPTVLHMFRFCRQEQRQREKHNVKTCQNWKWATKGSRGTKNVFCNLAVFALIIVLCGFSYHGDSLLCRSSSSRHDTEPLWSNTLFFLFLLVLKFLALIHRPTTDLAAQQILFVTLLILFCCVFLYLRPLFKQWSYTSI